MTPPLCSIPECGREADFATYILKPYIGKDLVMNALRPKEGHLLCAHHAATKFLDPDSPKHRYLDVYEALNSKRTTEALARFLPKLPSSRGGRAAFQRRAWKVFCEGDTCDYQRFLLKLKSGKLTTLIKDLDLAIPRWCSTPGCIEAPEEGKPLCGVCARDETRCEADEGNADHVRIG